MLNVGLALELEQLDSDRGRRASACSAPRSPCWRAARSPMSPEQAAIYARVLDAAGDRPVLFRTLDLGGDKLLPDAPPPEEENPAMGWRRLRIGLDRPALLRRQLRALLLAAGGRRAVGDVPDGGDGRRVPRRQGLLLAEAARVRPAPERARGRHHAGGAGAAVAACRRCCARPISSRSAPTT